MSAVRTRGIWGTIAALGCLLLATPAFGQVDVTATAGAPNASYTTLKSAFDAINAGTHQGDVTIDITANTTETAAPATLNSSGAGLASYTSVLIRPTNDGVSISGSTASGFGLIQLNGADNVTIDGDNPNSAGTNRNLTIQHTASSTTTHCSVIRIALATTGVTSANNNTIKNLILLGNATGRNISTATSTTATENASYGILATGGASTTPTNAPAAITSVSTSIGGAATATNLTIQNNAVTTAARAIYAGGSATTVFPGLLIENNVIGNSTAGATDQVYSMGVTAQGSTNAVIRGNTVFLESFVGTSIRALDYGSISASGSGAIFEKNQVLRVRANNVGTFGAYGINISGGSSHTIQNNFVADVRNDQTAGTGAFSTTFGAMGIRVGSGTGHKVYHNSVHMFGVIPGSISTNLTMAMTIVGTGQTGCDVRNNIFSNQLTGGNATGASTRHAALFLPSGATAAMNLTINNNAYYQGPSIAGALSLLAQVGTTAGSGQFFAADFNAGAASPASNLRAYTNTLSAAGTNDNASLAFASAAPFTTSTDLHIPAATIGQLESGGASVGVTVDMDGDTRPGPAGSVNGGATAPDIGADEFDGIAAIPPPGNDVCGANEASFTIPGAGGTASGSSATATNDAGLPSSACPSGTNDVWWYFTPTVTGNYLINTCASGYDTVVNVYTGACGALTEVDCNDDSPQCSGGGSELELNLTAATLYRIRVASKSGSGGATSLSVLGIPVNDDCGTAADINALCATGTFGWGGSFQQSNASATTDGTASCAASSRDLWYTFTPVVSGTWTIETCGTGVALDTVVSLYDMCGGIELNCNDDAVVACTSSPTHSRITPTLTAATTYWLRVASKGAVSTGGLILFKIIPPGPAGNDICAAVPDPAYTIPGTGGSVTGDLRIASSEGTVASSCQSGAGQQDLYYYFTPTLTCPWNFSTCGACGDVDTVISIHTACPDTLLNNQLGTNCVDQGCATGNLSFLGNVTLVPGTPYIIKVAKWDTNDASFPRGPFTLTVSQATPANDNCTGATTVVVTTGSGAASGNNECATDDGITPSCGATSKDMWYTFTTGATHAGPWIVDTTGSTIDTLISVYSGACPGTEIACDDDGAAPQSTLTINLLASTQYRVRVASKGASAGGAFSLNLTFAGPPVNDNCATASTITLTGTCSSATVSGNNRFADAPLEAGQPAMCAAAEKDMWYALTIPASPSGPGTWSFATCTATTQDTVLQVLDGCNGNELGCNDDDAGCGSGVQSRVTLTLASGTVLRIRVASKGTATLGGPFTLTVNRLPASNDSCANATPVAEGSFAWNNLCTTTDGAAFVPNCDPSDTGTNANNDVWFLYTASCTAITTVTTCGPTTGGALSDTVLAVYSVGACPPPDTSRLACDDDYDAPDTCAVGTTLRSFLTFSATQGTQYLIRVGAFSTTGFGNGLVNISQPADSTPPTIVTCAGDQTITADLNCQAVVPDFTGGVSATDNCSGAVITQSPLAGSTATGAGPHTITLTATDIGANTATCTATLTLLDPLSVSTHPQDVVSCVGGMASFSVTASGVTGYQWRHNTNPLSDGGNISGSNTATLTINPLSAADAGTYDVVLTNGCGSQTSNPASLTVNSTPTIVSQPVGGTVGYGAPFSFTVGATGGGLSYQWYRDGVPLVDGGTISGATTAMLSISSTVREDSGLYTVVVSNNCGSITSEPAYLEVNGNATVSLVTPPCASDGQLVVDVFMSASTSVVVGGQFFLAYDNLALDFVSAVPGDAPFVREVYEVVNEPAGQVDYAVGINDGDVGTSANTVMARLTFNVLADNCAFTPNLVTWRASGPNGAENKLSNATGIQVNINPVNLGPTRLDNTNPTITLCPSNINVHSTPGSCNSAPVTYSATATDNCTGSPTITFNPPSGSTFPPGTTQVLVTATDECGNSSTCTFDVINDGMVEMNVEVELGGGVMAGGTFNRAITLALWNTTVDNVNPLHTTCVNMSFSGAPKVGTATILVPCQPTGYDCITGRDRLHTLRRTISPIPITGPAYTPSFTVAKALIGGNLDDSKFIDIIDFGIYTTQDLTVAPGGANTVCGQNPPGFQHADITGNGVVNSLDYSFIANNFLMTREDNCNGSPITVVAGDGRTGARNRELPVTSITLAELQLRGLGNLAVMDLNQDGVFDLSDKGLWEQGVRPATGGATAPVGGSGKPVQSQTLDSGMNPVP